MFLFILDLSIELESVSPIIYKLNRHFKKKTQVCSINFLQNNSNNKILEYLMLEGVNYDNYPIKNYKYFVWKFFLVFTHLIPKIYAKNFRNFFSSVYRNEILFSTKEFESYLKKKKIKVVSMDTSIPKKKKEIIFDACKNLKIKIVGYNTGPEIIYHTGKITSEYLKNFDYYLEQNKLRNIAISKNKRKKIKVLGSARYSKEWMKILDKVYNFDISKKSKTPRRIGIFLTQKSNNLPCDHSLIQKTMNLEKFEIRLRNKPRDYMPNNLCEFYDDEMDTSEIVHWSDIIISTQTSAILEAIIKNKRVIFLNHLIPKTYGHWINKYKNVVFVTRNDSDLFEFLKKSNKKMDNLKYLKISVGSNKENFILNNYLNFYKKII